jgi:hypothetical protein
VGGGRGLEELLGTLFTMHLRFMIDAEKDWDEYLQP